MDDTIKLLLVIAGVTVGGTAVYDVFTPPAATWYSEGKMVPQDTVIQKEVEPEPPSDTFTRSPLETPAPKQKDTTSGYADFIKKPIPKMDDYPKSPEEAKNTDPNQFGWYHQ